MPLSRFKSYKLEDPGLSPAGGGILFNHKQGSIAHSLSLSLSHPDMTEITVEKDVKSQVIHPSTLEFMTITLSIYHSQFMNRFVQIACFCGPCGDNIHMMLCTC